VDRQRLRWASRVWSTGWRCCKPPGEKQAQPAGMTLDTFPIRHPVTLTGQDCSSLLIGIAIETCAGDEGSSYVYRAAR
jgi:hypothetical protein